MHAFLMIYPHSPLVYIQNLAKVDYGMYCFPHFHDNKILFSRNFWFSTKSILECTIVLPSCLHLSHWTTLIHSSLSSVTL